jgi:CRISPR-associated protein Cas2
MSFNRHLYLAAYDVGSDRLRATVFKLVRANAVWGQKSAYEIWLTPAECRDLLADIRNCLGTEDRFVLLRLDPRSRYHVLGRGRAPVDPDFFYVG